MSSQQLVASQLVPLIDVGSEEIEIIPYEGNEKVWLERIRSDLKDSGVDGATLLNFVKRNYYQWVHTPVTLLLAEYDVREGYTGRFLGRLASKRGNKVYAKRVKSRFKPLMELPDVKFFNYLDRSKNHRTRCMFVTLEYNANHLSIGEAMERVGADYNRWITAISKRYGSVAVVRVWESHKSGYPHIHAILLFEAQEFTAFHYNGDWRIQGKQDLEDYWPHGFTDVIAGASTKGLFTYVAKYLGKMHELGYTAREGYTPKNQGTGFHGLVERASLTTLSLMWVYRKRAFSVSGKFIDVIKLILHNSNPDEYFMLLQVDLEGGAPAEAVKEWVLCGFFIGDLCRNGRVLESAMLNKDQYNVIAESGSCFIDRSPWGGVF